jgi:parallel beta-helix repeat protein
MFDHDHICNDDHDHICDGGIDSDRRGFLRGCGAVFALAAAFGTSVSTAAARPQPGNLSTLLADLPKNWGRWGDEDELGMLNLLGSEQAFEGMHVAMQRGKKHIERFSLQLSITGDESCDPLFVGRFPARKDNTLDARFDGVEGSPIPLPGGLKYADDAFVTRLFLQGTTHFDALGHAWYEDHLYNGYPQSTTATEMTYADPVTGLRDTDHDGELEATSVTTTYGLGKADITAAASAGVAARGVLLDVGRYVGGDDDRLAPDHEITLDELRATAREQGVKLRQRDVILVRTGSVERARDPNPNEPYNPLVESGLVFSPDLVRWFHEMETPVVGADNVAIERATQVNSCLVIDKPGRYELTQDIADSTADVCIDIRVSDVVFDGNGYTIDGVGTDDSIGVYGNGTSSPGVRGNDTGTLRNVTIQNVAVTNWGDGIVYRAVENGRIVDVATGANSDDGIQLQDSNENTLNNNTVNDNGGDGITVWGESNRNQLENNTVSDNADTGIDFVIRPLTDYVARPSRNMLSNNTVSDNNGGGIYLSRNSATLTGNIITGNGGTGLAVTWANTIYNNVLNNSVNVHVSEVDPITVGNVDNTWNALKRPGPNIVGGRFIGGNYYAHPNGTGYSQTCTDANNDGFCDQPKNMSLPYNTNIDYLPLTKPDADQPDEDQETDGDVPADEDRDCEQADDDDAPSEDDDSDAPSEDDDSDAPEDADTSPHDMDIQPDDRNTSSDNKDYAPPDDKGASPDDQPDEHEPPTDVNGTAAKPCPMDE